MNKFIILLFAITLNLFGQADTSSVNNLSSLLEDLDLEDENSEMNEYIEYFSANPLDLNSTTKSMLEQLPFVDSELAEAIYNYIKKIPRIFSVKELYLIDNVNPAQIRNIIPFVTITSPEIKNKASSISFDHWKIKMRNRWSQKFTVQNEENSFIGSSDKLYNRIIVANANILQVGLVVEKDPGESNFSDLLSYHVSLRPGNFLDQVVLGDYNIEFGQALVLWSPYSFSKGTETVRTVKKKPRSVVAKSSSEEMNFYRGIAIRKSFDVVEVAGFYSVRNKDASLDDSGNITSLSATGYHRTQNEILKTGNTKETTSGFTLGVNTNNFTLNFLSFQSQFSRNIISDEPYSLTGNFFRYYSAAYEWQLNNFQWSGEVAYNGISVSSINNIYLPISKNVKAIVSFRNYPRNFTNLYGRGFGEQNGNKNESGLYFGASVTTDFGKLNLYFDKFKFPWASYHSLFPSHGSEYLLNFSSRKFNNLEIRIKAKYEVKEKTSKPSMTIYNSGKLDLKTELKYYPTNSIRLKSGFAYTQGNFENSSLFESGYLLYQDFFYHWNSSLQLYLRLLTYKTDSYNSRIYLFENGPAGTMTNLPFYDEGIKWYVFFKYSPINSFTISVKYSHHFRSQTKAINEAGFYDYGESTQDLSLQIGLKL